MSGDPEQPQIHIAVEDQSSGSDDEPYLRDGPVVESSEYLLFVPVTDTLLGTQTGINVERFLQTAVAIAADNDGKVLLLGIESVSSDTTLETVREYVRTGQPADGESTDIVETIETREEQLTAMTAVAQDLHTNVSVSGALRVVTDITEGILDVLDDGTEAAVLLPRGAGLEEGWLLRRSTVDRILSDAECNVFVENMGIEPGGTGLYVPAVEDHTVASLAESEGDSIDSILLPVGSGPHSALAAEAARAVARAAGASVTVLHVVPTDASAETRSDGEDLLQFAAYVLGSDVTVETVLREAPDTAAAIVEAATAHDFISIGAPAAKGRLESLVFESVQQTLSAESDATVLMSRDVDRTSRSLYYRWKRGIEAIEDESESPD